MDQEMFQSPDASEKKPLVPGYSKTSKRPQSRIVKHCIAIFNDDNRTDHTLFRTILDLFRTDSCNITYYPV